MVDISPEQRKALEDQLSKMSPEEVQKLIQEQCIFCKIIAGKVPAYKVYEDELVLAFLDIQPTNKGHVLVIPKKHYQVLPQMPDQEVGYLFAVVKNLSGVVFDSIKPEALEVRQRNGAAAGQVVPHVHVHIIPRYQNDGIVTEWKPKKFSEKELKETQEQIISALKGKFSQPQQRKEPDISTSPRASPQPKPKQEQPKQEPRREIFRPRRP